MDAVSSVDEWSVSAAAYTMRDRAYTDANRSLPDFDFEKGSDSTSIR